MHTTLPKYWKIFYSDAQCIFIVLVYRTESVAEKMLSAWFTFLLYKFLRVRALVLLLNVFHTRVPVCSLLLHHYDLLLTQTSNFFSVT